jgi:RNA exonuclease 4
MQKKDMYFAVDCEMVGVGPEGLDSALARVSIVNWDNEIVLDTYVRVDQEVTDYRTFVSGIRPEDIQSDSAMSLKHVRNLVGNILRGKILIGHALENDLKVMGLYHPWCDIRDTANYAPFMRTISKENDEKILCPRKLRDLVWEKLNKQIQEVGKAHSPVEDAIAAMDLYKSARTEWEMQLMQEVNRASNMSLCNQQPELREPTSFGSYHRGSQYEERFSCDPANQALVHNQHPQSSPFIRPMPDIVPTHPHHQYNPGYQAMNFPGHMNGGHGYHGNVPYSTLSSKRAQEIARRVQVVAALHQQRVKWQQQQQHQCHNLYSSSPSHAANPIYVENRIPM